MVLPKMWRKYQSNVEKSVEGGGGWAEGKQDDQVASLNIGQQHLCELNEKSFINQFGIQTHSKTILPSQTGWKVSLAPLE